MSTETADTQQLELRVKNIVASAFTIMDDYGLVSADRLMVEIKAAEKAADAHFDPKIKRLNDAAKAERADRDAFKKPLLDAEAYWKTDIRRYRTKRDEEDRLERIRREKESREEAQRRQLEEAVALEAAGDTELAEMVLDAPAEIVEVAPVAEAPKLSSSYRLNRNWGAEVHDKWALVQAVIMKQVDMDAIEPSFLFLNAVSRRKNKGNTGAESVDLGIPGVRGVEK